METKCKICGVSKKRIIDTKLPCTNISFEHVFSEMENTKEESWEKRIEEIVFNVDCCEAESIYVEKQLKELIKSLFSKAHAEEATGCFNHAQMEVEKEKARIREEIEKLPTKCARCEDFSNDSFSECICADKRMEFIKKEDIKQILK